jgi:hypothetical protein
MAIGRSLARAQQSVQWWLGDWWAFGDHRYGARTRLIRSEDWDGPPVHTCENMGRVALAITTSRRREVVTFTHHATVAALPAGEADSLLDWCLATTGKPRSTRELRDEMRRRKRNVRPDTANDVGSGEIQLDRAQSLQFPSIQVAAVDPSAPQTAATFAPGPVDEPMDDWLATLGDASSSPAIAIIKFVRAIDRAIAAGVDDALRTKLERIRRLLSVGEQPIHRLPAGEQSRLHLAGTDEQQ